MITHEGKHYVKQTPVNRIEIEKYILAFHTICFALHVVFIVHCKRVHRSSFVTGYRVFSRGICAVVNET